MTNNRGRATNVILVVLLLLLGGGGLLFSIWWLNQPKPGHVKDEALLAGRDPSSFPAADEDYFHDMDGGVPLAKAEIEGRNTWLVWTAGNDRLWDTLIYRSAGALDFLKILSSHPALLKIDPRFSRDKRWEYLGLLNDPCFEKPTGPDPDRWGLWLDHRRTDCKPDPFENEQKYPGVKIGSRGTKINGKDFPVGSYYGYENRHRGAAALPQPQFR